MDQPRVTKAQSVSDSLAREVAQAWVPENSQDTRMRIRIGRYQIKREIGGGGMGIVFEAIQDQPRRSVALKLMRSGFASRAGRVRFERESQLLARLRHPGIAQVFDAGTHVQGDDEVPYYVMEYIPGAKSITEYAAARHLGIRQRLELFAQACDAVHHANQRGIIHRDIKPQNLLVDSNGQVKVIDFGVARSLDSDMTPVTLQTEGDRLVGTLQYMSPEQCENDPHDLDARSDVYALGVVLYELLCDRLPYDVSKANLADATRIIREEPPIPPHVAKVEVGGDIETVILKAMHKERSRRYQTAAEFADDVRRVLHNEPIDARRDSATYRVRIRARARVAKHPIIAIAFAGIVALIAAESVSDLIRVGLRQEKAFYRFLTARVPIPGGNRFRNVRMIAIPPEADVRSLAQQRGINGVSADIRPSMRRLHGHLLRKLSDCEARGVALDLLFAEQSEFDEDLVSGIQTLKAKHIPVVVAVRTWELVHEKPKLSSAIAPVVSWGCASGQFNAKGPWGLDLVLRRSDGRVLPSFALAAAASFRCGEREPRYDFQALTDVVFLRDSPPSGETGSHRIELTFAEPRAFDLPDYGIARGDVVGQFLLAMPSDEALQSATISYADVLSASASQLQDWFANKLVVVGDARPGRDGPHPLADGRRLNGFMAQAAAIEAIVASRTIRTPRLVSFAGMLIWSGYLLDAAAVLAGCCIALAAASKHLRRVLLSILIGVVFILVCLSLYRYLQTLLNPLSAVMVLVFSAELVALVVRLRRQGAI